MSNTVEGRIEHLGETVQVTDKFKKRDIVLAVTESINGQDFVQYVKMQAVQTKTSIFDSHRIGDMVRVSYNLKGNRMQKDGGYAYFTNIDAWRVESAGQPQQSYQPPQAAPASSGWNAPAAAPPVYQPPTANTVMEDLPF